MSVALSVLALIIDSPTLIKIFKIYEKLQKLLGAEQ